MSDDILTDRDGAVGIVTINRPAVRNALSNGALAALVEALEALDADGGVRCIVLAGSEKVFASGADLNALVETSVEEIAAGVRAGLWARIPAVRTPVVAAVSGFCLGAGLELALMCEVIVASETARFGLPETGIGLIPGAGGTQRLTRAIGKAKAMDVILAGRLLSSAEADALGLVSRVVTGGAWLDEAVAVASAIAGRSKVAVAAARDAVDRAFETPLAAGLEAERAAFVTVFGSADAREGMQAFLEKRDPAWRDR